MGVHIVRNIWSNNSIVDLAHFPRAKSGRWFKMAAWYNLLVDLFDPIPKSVRGMCTCIILKLAAICFTMLYGLQYLSDYTIFITMLQVYSC